MIREPNELAYARRVRGEHGWPLAMILDEPNAHVITSIGRKREPIDLPDRVRRAWRF